MTLQFQQQINNKPTYFVEKIWNDFPAETQPVWDQLIDCIYNTSKEYEAEYMGNFNPKKHTIREDVKNRWHRGNPIHFKTWSGKPYHSKNINFAPVIEVVSIQKIEIKWNDEDGFKLETPIIYINGVWFTDIETLAINDGFKNEEDFYNYFNKNFTGKIIHWTNLKY